MSVATNQTQSARLLRLATYASVITASLLIIGKLIAWLLTGSVSVLASLVDSLMDVFASTINLVAVRYSLQPADAEHRFGHGKAESLAGLAQATFIAGSAAFLILEAVDRLIHPAQLEQVRVGVVVMACAIAATVVLLFIQRYVIRRTNSTAIRADALHYTTDVLTNAGTIVALLLASAGWGGFDPLFGIAIALYILHSAWKIGHEAFHAVMDHELPDDQRERIKELVSMHSQVRGMHDLRTRQSGQMQIIQMHLELDDHMPLYRAHAIADEVEASIRQAFPDADIIIHQDPATLIEPQQPFEVQESG